jgi:hypothetical protein
MESLDDDDDDASWRKLLTRPLDLSLAVLPAETFGN